MSEDVPILPLALGALLVFYVGYEVDRHRHKLRKLFNVFDKDESVVADALERLVNSGQLKPYGAVVNAT
jgi:hypothetical protein